MLSNRYFIIVAIIILITIFYFSKSMVDFIVELTDILQILPIPSYAKKIIFYLQQSFLDQDNKKEYIKRKSYRNVTPLKKKVVASKQKWKCKICQNILDYTYEVDHIVPIYNGGSNEIENLQALCRSCHGKKTLSSYI